MGFELTTQITEKPQRQTPSFVLRQANKARYAVACTKKKISTIFSNINNNEEYQMLGVDITPSCIYVCQIDNSMGAPILTGLSSVCMEGKFINEDILQNPDLYSETLKKLIRDNKLKAKKVAVSLPVSSSIVRIATISKMEDEDIRSAIKYGSLWQNIAGQNDSPDNYSIFYQIIRRETNAETMDILIVATKLADIKLYKDIVIKSGFSNVVVDAKTMALHYALKNYPGQRAGRGTILLELGGQHNYIMVMSDDGLRIIDIGLSDIECEALFNGSINKNPEIIEGVIERYKNILKNIINSYNKIIIEDIYVTSSLPLISDFISRLQNDLKYCNVQECNIFDYLVIPDNFTINKQSASNNISSWAGALSIAMGGAVSQQEEWIEIRKSPSYGVKYLRHYGGGWKLPDLSIKIGNFNPLDTLPIRRKINGLKLLFHPTTIALASAVCMAFMTYSSYKNLLAENASLSSNDIALSSVSSRYHEKITELNSLQNIDYQMESLKEASVEIAKEQNQQYVLSMYSYLDNVLQEGVWLKQLTFNAPSEIIIEGRSMDDNGVTSFLSTLDGSKMFSRVALKHMQSITELDLYAQNSVSLKSFTMKANLSDTLPDAYLYKPSLVAGGMNHGS